MGRKMGMGDNYIKRSKLDSEDEHSVFSFICGIRTWKWRGILWSVGAKKEQQAQEYDLSILHTCTKMS